jgi:nucleotide-binding universal stress UspA family protein
MPRQVPSTQEDIEIELLHDLVEQANADLVVLSVHGYSDGTKWLYGSMVANFISNGTTPLLIVQD